MRIIYFNLLLFFVIFNFSFNAFTLPTDRQQKATLQADQLQYNRNSGEGIYTGNVVIIQGTTKISADKLFTYNDKNNQLLKAIAFGHPATYSTIQTIKQQPIIATANQIEYNPISKKVILLGDAKVVQGENVLISGKILYDVQQQAVHTFSVGSQRTQMVFQPTQINQTKQKS